MTANLMNAKPTLLLLTVLSLLSAAGCAHQPRPATDGQAEGTMASIHDALQVDSSEEALSTSRATPPPPQLPAQLDAMLLPDLSAPGAQEEVLRFDVSVQDAPARSFFRSLVANTDINMVVHPEVSGQISLDLKNVSVDEVMELVRQAYGYEYDKTPMGYVVLPQRLQSRIFHVSYLNVLRQGESETRVSSGQVSQVNGADEESAGNGYDDESRSSSVTGSRIKTRTEADFWQELKDSLKTLLGEGEGRSVVISPHSGLVVVRALPSELRDIGHYLEQIQDSVSRQVILEAKIIEVELNDGFQSGINWGALATSDNNGEALFGQIGGGTLVNDNVSEIQGNTGNLNPADFTPLESLTTSAFGGMFSLSFVNDDFTAFIELLKTQGDVQVLSSPRVSTVNNQKAVIKVGTDEYFITGVETVSRAGTVTDQTTVDIELTPFFSGIALDVTPQINQDKEIILHIHPTISEVMDQNKQFTVNGEQQQLPLALSKVRESDNIVRAKSGQLVVIGGLMEDISRRLDASTPALGDLPWLGELFKHRKNSKRKAELVILLRPLVVENGRVWTDYVNDARSRIESLQGRPQQASSP